MMIGSLAEYPGRRCRPTVSFIRYILHANISLRGAELFKMSESVGEDVLMTY
jgi:hypothetical protein